jgi:hypothetical protein
VLIFVDESGDLGFQFRKGSSTHFTVALIVFASAEDALNCQRAIEELRRRLGWPDHQEFKFFSNSHAARLAFLDTVREHHFGIYTFTLDKQALFSETMRDAKEAYQRICHWTLENVRDDIARGGLTDAQVIIDGSGSKVFRRDLATSLRRQMNAKEGGRIKGVKTSRSTSDPLIQLADYVAGITNRLYSGKKDASEYRAKIARNGAA